VRCRQAAFRLRRRRETDERAAQPMRCAYADPPYPGLARMYADQPTYAGEVDHGALIAKLQTYDGWALSTGAYALREVLPLCPPGARICAWVKPIGVSGKSLGMHNAWEPVIVVPCRRRPPGFRDWLSTPPARMGGHDLIGRKPLAFAAFLFRCLGILPGDSLDDLFPGTGMIGKAWDYITSASDRADARLTTAATPAVAYDGIVQDASLLEQVDPHPLSLPDPADARPVMSFFGSWERVIKGTYGAASRPGRDDASTDVAAGASPQVLSDDRG
jgi:hypothetical protein